MHTVRCVEFLIFSFYIVWNLSCSVGFTELVDDGKRQDQFKKSWKLSVSNFRLPRYNGFHVLFLKSLRICGNKLDWSFVN